jgi:hypothetical protein
VLKIALTIMASALKSLAGADFNALKTQADTFTNNVIGDMANPEEYWEYKISKRIE